MGWVRVGSGLKEVWECNADRHSQQGCRQSQQFAQVTVNLHGRHLLGRHLFGVNCGVIH